MNHKEILNKIKNKAEEIANRSLERRSITLSEACEELGIGEDYQRNLLMGHFLDKEEEFDLNIKGVN